MSGRPGKANRKELLYCVSIYININRGGRPSNGQLL